MHACNIVAMAAVARRHVQHRWGKLACVQQQQQQPVCARRQRAYGCCSMAPSSASDTVPAAASRPSTSHARPPPLARAAAASISMFPGPVSSAHVTPPADRNVTFPMPPMFCSARGPRPGAGRNIAASSVDVSGAPCPPTAMSPPRKSPTVVTRVTAAITCGQRTRNRRQAATRACNTTRDTGA
jgi:hypothetical protein